MPKRKELLTPAQRSAVVREATQDHPWRRLPACDSKKATLAAIRKKAAKSKAKAA